MRISPSVPSSKILMKIAPPKPKPNAIPDPLWLPSMPPRAKIDDSSDGSDASSNAFQNGGPVCCFQCLDDGGPKPTLHRAMLLFAGSSLSPTVQSPIYCIPESHFPSKKLDTLPPRPSQPLLQYSRHFQAVGSPVFDPYFVMKALHHLDHLQTTIHQSLLDAGDNPPPLSNRLLQRDVYICEWVGGNDTSSQSGPNKPSNATGAPRTIAGREHFPVCVRGAGRPALSGEGSDNTLNIGIIHVPHNWIKLKDTVGTDNAPYDRLPTLTLVPPDAHILIPLLIKVAELELRMLKKAGTKDVGPQKGATAGLIRKRGSTTAAARSIHLDETWKSDFRAYLFRLPMYYLPAIRRVLRPMLPPSAMTLLNSDSSESCFSPTCMQKILNGEKAARDGIDWLRGMEQNLRLHGTRETVFPACPQNTGPKSIADFGYGQYDPRMSEHQYLNLLRNLPKQKNDNESKVLHANSLSPVALLPSSCLLPFYESRRRWIFGGSGLATRGLHVEGVNNDGANSHHYDANQKKEDEPLITLGGAADSFSFACGGCCCKRLLLVMVWPISIPLEELRLIALLLHAVDAAARAR
ncbi:hypothetical protein ACHAWF_013567 [Thalassiosira exigua]